LLPLRAVVGGDGAVVALSGHLPRAHALTATLRRDPAATALFVGAQGYVSPSWMRDRTQAPTWNFASVRFRLRVRFDDDAAALKAHLDDLVAAMERAAGGDWSVGEMGARFEQLAQRIVAFRAEVVATRARFKLGQDERDDVFADIVAALSARGDAELAAMMTAFNPGRGTAGR
jgi:transcriptional regulator